MNLEHLRSLLPDYAKDLRLNLESVLSEAGAPGLTRKQIALVALATAIAARYEPLTAALAADGAAYATETELNGARAAAAIMAMNNVYYRFTHLVEDPEYQTLRAGLRMNALVNPGCDKLDFELCSLAISAINGCGTCVASHEKTLRKHGLGVQAVQSAVRIAAVVHAVAVTLEQRKAASGMLDAAA